MKKTVFLLVLMVNISSCSFIIDSNSSEPTSTHIPSIVTGENIFFTLKGTIWKLDGKSTDKDTYLYIDKYENKYAIKPEKKGVRPERYPDSYEYTALGSEQDLITASTLKKEDTVIFDEKDNSKKFIGFHLKSSFELYSANSTGSTSIIAVVEGLERGTGDKWKLYRY